MGMLDRYKKKGGFVQLLQLIETTAKPKQEQFLNLIKNENPVWEQEIKSKLITVDKILNWPTEIHSEIFSRVQHLTLSVVLKDKDQATVDRCLSFLSHSEKRKINDLIDEKNPSPAEISSASFKFVSEVRTLLLQGIIKVDKFDPALAIPENVEEKLALKMDEAPNLHLSEIENNHITTTENKSNSNELRFELPKVENQSIKDSNNKDELDFLKRKVNALVSENNQLKHELSVVRNKLEQIKKIA